jgi:hypothetical protein
MHNGGCDLWPRTDVIRAIRLCFHTGLTVNIQAEGDGGIHLATYHYP